ncbi:hypothetical protein DFP72DRAFT_933130 [Ephemerocybe angulata]|uniref:Uncharacterized protein n=1 Tax=Ephemerocybe angulata TaxID=980116 RepID=A0A8H6HBK2_9AGAR|nr:hypothetical protein DFP72DRAFT_933130 [Tulosesus angulatus]
MRTVAHSSWRKTLLTPFIPTLIYWSLSRSSRAWTGRCLNVFSNCHSPWMSLSSTATRLRRKLVCGRRLWQQLYRSFFMRCRRV